MDAQHTKHVTYKLAYHFVWCPKYRKKILVGKLATFVEQEIRRICEARRLPDWRGKHPARPCPSLSFCFSICCHCRDCTPGKRNNRPQNISVLPSSEEISLGRCLLVPVVLCWQCRRYERGYRTQIYRVGTRVVHSSDPRLICLCIFGQGTLDNLLSSHGRFFQVDRLLMPGVESSGE